MLETLILKIINAQNETVKTINHLADKGFNTISYDLTVNATEKSKKADDGNVYITPKIHGRNFHQWSYGKEIAGSERKT